MTEEMKLQNQELIKKEVEKLIVSTKERVQAVKRIAVDEAWKILQLAVAEIIQAIEINVPNLAGKDKKNIAMELLSTFYDSVFLVINVPFVPHFIQPIIRKSIKSLLMLLVSATIDAMVTTFRNAGIFSSTQGNQK